MNKIFIKSKRSSLDKLKKDHPDASIIDVTSKADQPWVRFSPFYPHGGIPIPFSFPETAMSVEGIWQGLKVFENQGIDRSKFENRTMKNLKRSVRTCGKVVGHQRGTGSNAVLSYAEARKAIYIPSYMWVIENCLVDLMVELSGKFSQHDLVLLDYETNCDVDNLSRPLSHASLIKRCLEV